MNSIPVDMPRRGGGSMVWLLVLLMVLFLAGGFVLYTMYLNPADTTTLPVSSEQTTPSVSASPTPPETDSSVSEMDNTATIKKEFDSTPVDDTSASDSATLDADINQL